MFFKESWEILPKITNKYDYMQSDQPVNFIDDPCYFKLYIDEEDYECWTLRDLVFMQDLFLMTSLQNMFKKKQCCRKIGKEELV